jgi:hypothetical protein
LLVLLNKCCCVKSCSPVYSIVCFMGWPAKIIDIINNMNMAKMRSIFQIK